jgi:hypothetical protein
MARKLKPNATILEKSRREQLQNWALLIAAQESDISQPFFDLLQWWGEALLPFKAFGSNLKDPTTCNLALLAKALDLSPVESDVLRLFGAMGASLRFQHALHESAAIRPGGLAEALALALQCDPLAVTQALDPNGRLVRSGILRYAAPRHGQGEGFVTCLFLGERANLLAQDAVSACSQMVYDLDMTRAPRLCLGRAASACVVPLFPAPPLFLRAPEEVDRLCARLEAALAAPEQGVHFLLVGPRREGRSLCRALSRRLDARSLGCGGHRDVQPGEFAAYHAGHYLLAQALLPATRPSLLTVESAACLLHPVSYLMVPGIADPPWTYLRLTEATVPCLWLVPSLDVVDPRVLPLMSEIVEL